MSDSISPGDVVMMVRGHRCLLERAGGVPFRVSGFTRVPSGWLCRDCCELTRVVAAGALGFPECAIPLPWLKKLEPPPEIERTQRPEEVRA